MQLPQFTSLCILITDLANDLEAAIHNMFNNIVKWDENS